MENKFHRGEDIAITINLNGSDFKPETPCKMYLYKDGLDLNKEASRQHIVTIPDTDTGATVTRTGEGIVVFHLPASVTKTMLIGDYAVELVYETDNGSCIMKSERAFTLAPSARQYDEGGLVVPTKEA